MIWKNLSKDELRREYNIVVPGVEKINAQFQNESASVRADLPGQFDLAYDEGGERHMLDIFTVESSVPSAMLVFVHGGFWKVNSKNARRFPAKSFVENNIAWTPINYRLAPGFSIDEIVEDGRNAIAWLYRNAEKYNCDPERIYVSGNSAGGHMVAMLCADGWQSQHGLPKDVIKGGCALSGIFDLEPLLYTEPNDWLKMDIETAQRNSPIYTLPGTDTKMIITCGSEESGEFRRQSRDYAELLENSGIDVRYFEMEGDNHFSIIGKLADTDSPVFSSIVKMIEGT
jgi:arylformamidase